MKIIKYKDYINENSNITETEILEFLKEQWNAAYKEILLKTVSKFPIKTKNITTEQQSKIDECISIIVKTTKDIIIDNSGITNKDWILPEDKIELGDALVDDTGKEYYVSKLGSNNDFYDDDKKNYFDLSGKKKKI